MTPGARSNTKYRCNGCGAIEDFTARAPTNCRVCGEVDWDQIVVAFVCDFCSGANAHWEYRCKDFAAPTIPGLPLQQMSRGSWAACEECHVLIEANDRRKLVERGIETQHGEIKQLADFPLNELVGKMHEGFFANRIGEAIYHESAEGPMRR